MTTVRRCEDAYRVLLGALGLRRRPGRGVFKRCESGLRSALARPTWGSGHVPQALYTQMFSDPEVGLLLSLYYWGATLRGVFQKAAQVGKNAQQALDIGCGGGVLSCLLALACPGLRVVGIDRCEAAVEAARWLAGQLGVSTRVSFVCGDVNAWTTDARFDLFISIGGLLPASDVTESDLWEQEKVPFFSAAALAPPALDDRARLRLQACAARVRAWGTQRAAWVMCERLGTIPGNMYFLKTLGDVGWGANWNQSRWAASGADDAAPALPLWVLRADFQLPDWSQLGDCLLNIWLKLPACKHWRGEGWALHAEAEQRLRGWPGHVQVWGVALWIEGFGRLRIELWQVQYGAQRTLYYQTHEAGARQLLWNLDGVESLRRFFQNLSRNFNVEGIYNPDNKNYEPPRDELAAHNLGAWLFEADFRLDTLIQRANKALMFGRASTS